MPLNPQLIEVPLSLGLDQKADVRSLAVQGAVNMQNCVKLKNGAIRKRFGNTLLNSAYSSPQGAVQGSLSSAYAMGSYKGSPLLSDGGNLYSFSDNAQSTPWTQVDAHPEAVALDHLELFSWTPNVIDVDQCVIGNYLITVFNGYDTALTGQLQLYFQITNYVTRAVVSPPCKIFSDSDSLLAPKVIALGNKVYLTYFSTNSTAILLRTLLVGGVSPQISVWSAAVSLATDVVAVQGRTYDMSAIVGDATRFAVAYPTTNAGGGNPGVSLSIYGLAGGLNSQRLADATANQSILAMSLYSTNNEQHLIAYSYTVSSTTPTTALLSFPDPSGSVVTKLAFYTGWTANNECGRLHIKRQSSTDATVLWSPDPTMIAPNTDASNLQNSYIFGQQFHISAGAWGTIGPLKKTFSCLLASRSFAGPSAEYVLAYLPSALQGTYYLCAIDWWGNTGSSNVPTTLRAVCTFDPRLSKNTAFSIPSSASNTSRANIHAVQLSGLGTSQWAILDAINTSPKHTALLAQVVDMQSPVRLGMSELFELEGIACGVPSYYDGQSIGELGFLFYPQVSVTAAGSGGSLSAGTYQVSCTWEMYDARGQLHVSAPSPPVVITAANNDKLTITSSTLGLTNRRTLFPAALPPLQVPYLVEYRTTANGTIFYRVTPDPPANSDAISLTAATLTKTDGVSDASITSNAVLYTTGGVLANFNPPSSRIQIVHKSRWWNAGCPDPTSLWPSQALISGTAPAYNEVLNVQATGAVRALQSMDDKLLLFVQRGSSFGIEYMTGDGPNNLGTQSDWSPPQAIPSDTGAVDQRGTCVGQFGCLFHGTTGGPNGSGGIFLLTRDLQVKYVSKNVEDTLAANPVVTSMVVHPNNGRVYITCTPTEPGFGFSGHGVRLVWDYLQDGIWSTDLLADASGSGFTDTVVRCATAANSLSQGTSYYWATAQGVVYRETMGTGANSYLDNATWVPMTYQSAWLKPELSMQGRSKFALFWRVQLEADQLDPHNFTMQLTYDYAPSSYYQESYTWTADKIAAFDRAPQEDIQLMCGNQKAKAIQVTLTDATPTGAALVTGQGPSWAQIILELGVESGKPFLNLPAAQRA